MIMHKHVFSPQPLYMFMTIFAQYEYFLYISYIRDVDIAYKPKALVRHEDALVAPNIGYTYLRFRKKE